MIHLLTYAERRGLTCIARPQKIAPSHAYPASNKDLSGPKPFLQASVFVSKSAVQCRELLFCQASLPLHRCMGLCRHTERRFCIKKFPIQGSHCHKA